MENKENDPNRKMVEEVTSVLAAAAAERISGDIEPAFVYFIEARSGASGENE